MNSHQNGFPLYYTESGPENGPVVIFIHGFPFNHAMWEGQVEVLQNKWRCVTYDVRGHGRSKVSDYAFTLEFFVEDLVALMERLNIQKAVLCGLSMGGYIALRFAELYPDRLLGLVLCDTRSEADTNEAKVKRSETIRNIRKDGVTAFADAFVKNVFREESLEKHPQAVESIKQMIRACEPAAIAGTLVALAARTDTTAALPKITVPTLILVGEDDKLTPPIASQSMHEAIEGSDMYVIPDAAHMSNLENSQEFNKRLKEFLEKVAAQNAQ